MILQNLDVFFADNSLGVCSSVRRYGFAQICHSARCAQFCQSERSEESHTAQGKFDFR